MGKKSKKSTKGKGAEKTAKKTEKNMDRKAKKDGELDDFEEFLQKLKEQDQKAAAILVDQCNIPSPRVNFTFTANPEKGEIYLFGGEFDDGKKTYLYNDLFTYLCQENLWYKITSPRAPYPRCGHQAVFYKPPTSEGQLWIFGGEYASPTQTQFHHYRDLHCFNVNSKKWELGTNCCGPAARSGHRMQLWKKSLILFGGFQDSGRYSKYFNDLWMFDLEQRQWTELKSTIGTCPGPSPRSGFIFLSHPDFRHIYLLGGFSKEKLRKDVEKPIVHEDAFQLTISRTNAEENQKSSTAAASAGAGVGRNKPTSSSSSSSASSWSVKWIQIKPCGPDRPALPRSGMSGVQFSSGPKALVFGGVTDREEDDETLLSEFHDDFYHVELDKARWSKLSLNKTEETTTMEVEENQEKIEKNELEAKENNQFEIWPSPRINCGLAMINKTLYLFGGLCEIGDDQGAGGGDDERGMKDSDDEDEDDQQVTLNDFYAVDIGKTSHGPWRCLNAGSQAQYQAKPKMLSGKVKELSDCRVVVVNEECENQMEVNQVAETNDIETETTTGKEVTVPIVNNGESFADYWNRTHAKWKDTIAMELDENSDDDDEEEEESSEDDDDVEGDIPDEILIKYAKETALKYYRKNVK